MHTDRKLRDELLAEVEAIAQVLERRAPEAEKLGRLDDGAMEALRDTRLLRVFCPRELGGEDADSVTQMEVLEALARDRWLNRVGGWDPEQ